MRSSSARRIWAFMLCSAGSHAACLPLDDLSSYTSADEGQPSEQVNGLSPDAIADGDELADSGAASGGDARLDAGDPPLVIDAGALGSDLAVDSGLADAGASPSSDAGQPDASSAL